MKCKWIGISAAACLCLVSGACRPPEKEVVKQMTAEAYCTRLGRGLNLGNALDAPKEGDWGVVLEDEHFRVIREAGFDSVRLPVRWSAHAQETPPYTIDSNFFARVDHLLNVAYSNDLAVVLDVHHYEEIMADPEGQRARFLSIWRQIAERYAAAPPLLSFEILNEPQKKVTDALWNELLADALAVIRKSNPDRPVVIGPTGWNNLEKLPVLELPAEDRQILVTIHYYEPFRFTHQGASWIGGSSAWMGMRWTGTDAENKAVADDLEKAAQWAKADDRPLYLGEFGAYKTARMEDRALWTAFVREQAELRGMSWAYWEFCSGFGVYDAQNRSWREPLLNALVPEDRGQ